MIPATVSQALPPELISFIATTLLACVVGLELHSYRRSSEEPLAFGTTRTLTLVGAFGFILYLVGGKALYAVGLLILGAWLGMFYWRRLASGNEHLLTLLVALSAYLFGPLALKGPLWLLVLYAVVIILMLGGQTGIRRFSDAFRSGEALTLGKFLIMAGLVLPLLPDRQIADFITVTWYRLWLTVVVVSGISYLSYLAQTYFVPGRGVLLTGLLGGLYSSTAVTVVLARRAQKAPQADHRIGSAIVLATMMMYLRLWILMFALGSHAIALNLALPFAAMFAVSGGVAWLMYGRPSMHLGANADPVLDHPLEFSAALLFAFLFILFAGLTNLVIARFGIGGLHLMAFGVGFTDIDPFILSVLAGHFHVSDVDAGSAVLIATGSNNLLKAVYSIALSRSRALLPAALWLVFSFAASMAFAFWLT
jgi:uncharacterized membrane protein (DUF4010 family)